ncbi:21254_t:CDS:2 [Dentiscutata erythropus]|uniref:Putative gamma-glutamylcyclotransferase n=1 Tax=Dentiscutata erythropus TaxID=1348616 RepID=A0A9N8VGH8_9GLOM|nr:21254_t:CDS:2 [Dentiscutata erythropus]
MSTDFSCFLYGTLIFPEVIGRILSNGGKEKITVDLNSGAPAVLKGYKRYQVRGAWYPAIIKSNENDEAKGVFLKGLSYNDILKLDDFEGDQYKRMDVKVFVGDSLDPIPAQTYVWIDSANLLDDKDWDSTEFKKKFDMDMIDLSSDENNDVKNR